MLMEARMAREIVWRCDGCGDHTDPAKLEEFLHRPCSMTTQNYRRSVQLCPGCQLTHSAADIVNLTLEHGDEQV
jgi:hypothetical protein